MNTIFKQLELKKKELHVRFHKGVAEEEYNKAVITIDKLTGRSLPSEYIELIGLSNGFSVTEVYDCMIYDLKLVIRLIRSDKRRGENTAKETGKFYIGVFWEDYIYIDQNNMIAISFQGIDEPVDINMTLKEFLQKNIDRNFEIFWDEQINLLV